MNDERCEWQALYFLLGCFYGGDENGDEFVSFLAEVGQLCGGDYTIFDKQFHPICCLVQFLQSALHFTDEVGSGFPPVRFAVMCAHRGSTPQHLLANRLGDSRLWKRRVQPNDSQSGLLRTFAQALGWFGSHDGKTMNDECCDDSSLFVPRSSFASAYRSHLLHMLPRLRRIVPKIWLCRRPVQILAAVLHDGSPWLPAQGAEFADVREDVARVAEAILLSDVRGEVAVRGADHHLRELFHPNAFASADVE